MRRDEAWKILTELTRGAGLLRHARMVELVMRAYAARHGEDPEEWGIAGLLHDADYEAHPDRHPQVIVLRLRALGEERLAHAISAHYTKWDVPYDTTLSRALVACDELTGFIGACALVRPDRLRTLAPKSVLKKLKDRSFAATVEREEVTRGAEIFGVDLAEHVAFIVAVLLEHEAELELAPP